MIIIDGRCLQTNQPTGVSVYTRRLLDALFAYDQTNEYVVSVNGNNNPAKYLPNWQNKNVTIVATRWPNKILNILIALSRRPFLDSLIKLPNKTPLIFFSPNFNFTVLSSGVKHILTIHDLSFEHFPGCFTFKQRLWHRLLRPRAQARRATMIVTPSEHTKYDVMETYGIAEDKIMVIPPVVEKIPVSSDKTDFKLQIPKLNKQLPKKFILYVGTLEPRKNVAGLIEAFVESNLFAEFGVELVIAGSSGWKSSSLLAMIAKTPGVLYCGYVNEEEKAELYRNAQLFVYPSLYEGFGLPVYEAMQYGLPVITSNRSSLPELASLGKVELVNPYNVSELSMAMKRMCQTPPRDLQSVSDIMGNEEIIKKLLDKIKQILDKNIS